ncbi:MAG: glycosyltransferase family 39 protein [bacterium]
MKRISVSSEWLLLSGLALGKLASHFLTSTNYELHRDTYLFLALGDHLDWGYVSVPPAIAFFARLSQTLFGDSVFAIGILPALIGALSILLVGLMVKSLGGKIWAIALAGTAFLISPAFLRSNSLFQPVSFDQFFWLLTTFLALRLLQTRNPKLWLPLGAVCGLAFLNKYAIAFLVCALLLSFLLAPDRQLLFSKYFVFGLLAGLLIVLPNLLWQMHHNWPVLAHMAELQLTQLVNVSISNFLLMQVLMNLPGLLVWLAGLAFFLFSKAGKGLRVLGYAYLAVILIFILFRGKHYYTLGIYPLLFAAGGFWIEKHFTISNRWMRPALLALMIMIALPVIPYSLPVLAHERMLAYAEKSKNYGLANALRWEDGKIHPLPQDYADMIGWEELANVVIRTYHSLSDSEKARCVIYAENYGQAGAIKYYGKKHGLPEPASFNETFLFWAPDSVDFTTLIYVNDEIEEISYFFAEVRQVGKITNAFARESGLPVFLCRHPRNGFFEFYREKVRELKNGFRS